MSDATKAVFLSYASQDAEAAKRICEALRDGGVEVWFDQNELRGDVQWDARINNQIRACALFRQLRSLHTALISKNSTMIKIAIGFLSLAVLTLGAGESPVSPAVRSELAPTGRLRVGIHFANSLLAVRDPVTHVPSGIALDLARELGRRLGVSVEIVSYDAPGPLAEAANSGAWDVGFLGAEPERANEISFTAAYMEIEATYLVPPGSPLKTIADVDRDGIRIVVFAKSAYDLFLTRNLRHASLTRAANADAAFKMFASEKLDALAGLKPRLVTDADKLPGARVLDGRFTVIQQAIGTPKGRDAGAKYLQQFVEEIKASGLVAQIIEQNRVRGVSVAPKASPQ